MVQINFSPFGGWRGIKRLIFTCLLFAAMQTGRAQVAGTPYIGEYAPCTSMGTDFWMTFENNQGQAAAAVYLALNIVTQVPTTVTISCTAGKSYTYNIAGGISRRIDLNKMVSDGKTDTTDERAHVYRGATGSTTFSFNSMHITSTALISVYAFNTFTTTTDATVVYPVADWGTDYYQISCQPYSGYVAHEFVIADQDNTVLTPYSVTGAAGATVTLSAGQVYAIQTGTGVLDLTGKHFTSNKPVAYFAGDQLVFFPAGTGLAAGDVFDEQMLPTNLWDKQYYVPNVPQSQSGNASVTTNNRIRIVAAQNGTVVNYTGASLPASFSAASTNGNNQITSGGTLNAGQWVELAINSTTNTGGAYITASNPVGVAGYLIAGDANGGRTGSPSGDPDNAVMPGLNQMVQLVTISPFIPGAISSGSTQLNNPDATHGAIIVSRTATKGSVTMTRAGSTTNLLTGTWIDDPNGSGTSSYYYTFDNTNDIGASFTISSPGGVFVMAYGIANYESYYYNAGSGACSL